MDTKNVVVGAIAIVALVLGALGFMKTAPAPQVAQDQTPQLGATAGLNTTDNCTSKGGVISCDYRMAIASGATTTPYVQKGPAATSTLMLGSGCRLSVSSTTAKTSIVFAKSAVPNASTTRLFSVSTSANNTVDGYATTSSDSFTFAPNSYFSMSMIGGTGVDSPTGVCEARFQLYQ